MKKLSKVNFLKAISYTVAAIAAISAGMMSTWIFNQPKVPAKLIR